MFNLILGSGRETPQRLDRSGTALALIAAGALSASGCAVSPVENQLHAALVPAAGAPLEFRERALAMQCAAAALAAVWLARNSPLGDDLSSEAALWLSAAEERGVEPEEVVSVARSMVHAGAVARTFRFCTDAVT